MAATAHSCRKGVPSSCKESQELNKGSLASWGGQVILHRDHLHFFGATTRTVSTAEITGIAFPAAYLLDVCCVQEISFMVG